jgi:DNA-binding Lrp family transcriptional regulator
VQRSAHLRPLALLMHLRVTRRRKSPTTTEHHATTMIETAYLLVKLDRNTPAEVARLVRRVPGVVEAAVTMGEVDVLAIARDQSTKGLAEISHAVEKIQGVARVSICVVVRP